MNVIITDKQKEALKPYIPDIEQVCEKGLGELLIVLDDAIIGKLGNNYCSTAESEFLQDIYDEIYNQY